MYKPPEQLLKRTVVYPKDVANITGQSMRSARRILQNIRESRNRINARFVTAEEFCDFTGMAMETVIKYLKF